jgi:hypothetical protein
VRGYQLRHLGLKIRGIRKNYLLAFAGAALVFAVFAGASVAVFAWIDVLPGAAVEASVAEFEPKSVIGGCVVSTVESGLEFNTETFPCKAGIVINNAESIKKTAAAIVIFDKTVAVPRGPKAELEILLVNNAPASVFPGCSKTETINATQEIKNIV